MRLRSLFILSLLIGLLGLATSIYLRPFEQIKATGPAPIRGSYHIHTSASHDGVSTPGQLTQAAQELGLQFLVVTDHNTPGLATGHSNLIVLTYPELSTPFGHVVGFGLKQGLSAPLRKEPWVLKEIQSRGGKAILAHPTRRRNPWQGSWENVGGVEIHNIADQVQNDPMRALEFLLTLPFHAELALAHLFKRDAKALSRWDDFSDPQVIGVCANDSHGRFGATNEIGLWKLELNAPWPEDVKGRNFSAIHSLATGSFHCSSSIIEHGGGFNFSALLINGETRQTGQTVSQAEIESLIIQSPSLETDSASMVLLRNGEAIARSTQKTFEYRKPTPGTYRVEVHLGVPGILGGQESIPVIYSNKIRVRD